MEAGRETEMGRNWDLESDLWEEEGSEGGGWCLGMAEALMAIFVAMDDWNRANPEASEEEEEEGLRWWISGECWKGEEGENLPNPF